MTQPERFEITEEHITLLRKMYVDWCDDEFGAPAIDPKRPYGNSDVESDMAEILGWTDRERDLTSDEERRACALHREMQKVLQIVLRCASFSPGVFERPARYSVAWAPVASGVPPEGPSQ